MGRFRPPQNTVTIAASGLLIGVSRDATLVGDGTIGSPLGVALPLFLTGSVGLGSGGVIVATNGGDGFGVVANGGVRAFGYNPGKSGLVAPVV
jgi:hypothetical protein